MAGHFKSHKRSIASSCVEGALFGFVAAIGVWLVLYSLFRLGRIIGGDADLSGGGVHIDLVPFAFELPKLVLFFVPVAAVSRLVVAVLPDKSPGYASWVKSAFLTLVALYGVVLAAGFARWLWFTQGSLAAHLRDSADPLLWIAAAVVLILLSLIVGLLGRFSASAS